MDSVPGVLILHNIPGDAAGKAGVGAESEAGVMVEVSAVAAALTALKIPHRVAGIHQIEDLPGVLATHSEPVIFNLVEELPRHPQDATFVPAICESFRRHVTGCDSPCLALTQDKWKTKAVLQASGVPVPAGVIVPVNDIFRPRQFPGGPYIVKPVATDASEGIDAKNIFARAGMELQETVVRLHRQFNQPVLIEQFVGAREFNVSVFQDASGVQVLPIAEIDFSALGSDRHHIVDYAAKWMPDSFQYQNTPRIIPAPLKKPLARAVRDTALRAWHAIGCRDFVRVDMRMDDRDRLFVLEINANPDISPDAGFCAALHAGGITFEKFVDTLVHNAGAHRAPATRPTNITHESGFIIRPAEARDRDEVLHFVEATTFFRPGEIAIAREVFDDGIHKGPEGGYKSFVAELDGHPIGWISFGATACTEHTYDVYWIVVAPDQQGRGVGRALVKHAERFIGEWGGRLVVIETSGQALYQTTRGFYLKLGFLEQARVTEFYAPGDDKIIYVKHLA